MTPLDPFIDTSQLFKEDTLRRIKHLCDEIAASQRRMEKVRKEVAIIEERIHGMKKEPGFIGDDPDCA